MNDTDREVQERFGANVNDLRQRRGLSVDALAERSELDPRDLAKILAGETEARSTTVYLLAGALDVDPGALFNGLSWSPPADGGAGYVIGNLKPR
jgi:transcriptional regulator with XRE-family HTH domain